MSDAIRRALCDELERACLEFAEFVREFPADLYDVVVPGEDGTVRQIFGHVVRAGYGHVLDVAESAGVRTPKPRFMDPGGLDDAESFVAALLDVGRFAHLALAEVDDKMLEKRFQASWGQEYDGEQMMEHAACHPPRHARQLRRFLDGELEG